MIGSMKEERLSETSRSCAPAFRGLILICLAGAFLASCASAPPYPLYPAPTTRVVPAGFDDAFMAALTVLRNDERLELDTIDKAGRFIAMEKTSGFIFFRHRTILDMTLEPVGEKETKIVMKLKAEDYEMGWFTLESGWYPSPGVDESLGAEIMDLVEKNLAETSP